MSPLFSAYTACRIGQSSSESRIVLRRRLVAGRDLRVERSSRPTTGNSFALPLSFWSSLWRWAKCVLALRFGWPSGSRGSILSLFLFGLSYDNSRHLALELKLVISGSSSENITHRFPEC